MATPVGEVSLANLTNKLSDCWGEFQKEKSPILHLLGWLLTAAALSLGAPFWFDLLKKFINLRGAGQKPAREDKKTA